jgi:hypothetical protein
MGYPVIITAGYQTETKKNCYKAGYRLSSGSVSKMHR